MMHEVMRQISQSHGVMQNIQGVRQNCYLLFLSWPKFPDFCLLVHVICIYSIDIKLQEDPPSNSKFCLSIDIMLSFVNGMSEFLEGEVSLVCRKIILIHGRNPGFYYLDLKRFK